MTGLLITARLGSSRLPQKHLLPIDGKPVMGYLIDRMERAFGPELGSGDVKIIISTSAEAMNTAFRQFVPPAHVFYGDIKNLPFRQLQAAYTHELDYIVSVDGDDILCSVQAMRDIATKLEQGESYVSTKGLPFGMNAFGYSQSFLERSLENSSAKILETGWGRIFDENERSLITYPQVEAFEDKLRLTLDYQEDFDLFKSVIEELGDTIYTIPDTELITHIMESGRYKTNTSRIEEYWNNFNTEKEHHG